MHRDLFISYSLISKQFGILGLLDLLTGQWVYCQHISKKKYVPHHHHRPRPKHPPRHIHFHCLSVSKNKKNM